RSDAFPRVAVRCGDRATAGAARRSTRGGGAGPAHAAGAVLVAVALGLAADGLGEVVDRTGRARMQGWPARDRSAGADRAGDVARFADSVARGVATHAVGAVARGALVVLATGIFAGVLRYAGAAVAVVTLGAVGRDGACGRTRARDTVARVGSARGRRPLGPQRTGAERAGRATGAARRVARRRAAVAVDAVP